MFYVCLTKCFFHGIKHFFQVLLNGKSVLDHCENEVSVRRFKTYGLLQTKLMTKTDIDDEGTWYQYSANIKPEFQMEIK